MDLPYIRVIVLLHAAFGGVFYFLNRQYPAKFARMLAWCWAIEGIRAAMLLPGVPDQGWGVAWFTVADVLCVFANWCLLSGCAEMAGVRPPSWLRPLYVGLSVPILVFDRLLLPQILFRVAGLPLERGIFYGVMQNLLVMFIPVAVTRGVITWWLFRVWVRTRLPGALLAGIFCAPYAFFAFTAPMQYFFSYHPEWVAIVWCARVIGFSIGLLMMQMSRQFADLQKSEARLEAAQASARLGSWEFDLGTGALLWSAELYRIFGRSPSGPAPAFSAVAELIHREERPAFEHHFVRDLAGSRGYRGLFRLVLPGGGIRWIETITERLGDSADGAGRLTGTMQDVTEKRQLEEQFLRAQRVENLGLLAAGIAHDFNNILTPVLMVSPMLRERMTDGVDRSFLSTIEKSAERGAALVRQILAFVHGTGGRRHLVQSKHVVRELASMIAETFPRTIKLDLTIPPQPWAVVANPTQLHQVLLNFCVNARDAMPEGGTLTLRLSNCTLDAAAAAAIPGARTGQFVLLEVGDTGRGIPPEVLPHIWEPFFTTKGPEKGTGLGLATVRGIVGNHDGFCTVATEVGRGTTFRVYLPAAEEEIPPEGGSAHPFIPRGQGQLVLVVDDEANVREFISATLANHGYRVLAAADGQEGLVMFNARETDVALVITDCNMPQVTGEAFALAVRKLKPAQPLLFISGLSNGPASGVSADPFLPKPFKPAALLEAVHRLLATGDS